MGGNILGNPLALSGVVTAWAGDSSAGATDCTVGAGASFSSPSAIATDGQSIYVADSGNNLIRKIVIATSTVSTLAGDGTTGATDCTVGAGARFNRPRGITTDGQNLYVADTMNCLIRKIVIATGAVSTVAGTGTPGATDCTVGVGASFDLPRGITTDGTYLYLADTQNHKIRRIAIGGMWTVTTLAGDGAIGATDCTVGAGATFNLPYGITTDGSHLYVADSANHKIRTVAIATGAVTTLAGDGSIGATDCTVGAGACFNSPYGTATDGKNLYVADTSNQLIRKIVISSGAVTTLAGDGTTGATDCTVGTGASFNTPRCVTTDGTFLFVADTANNMIRKIR